MHLNIKNDETHRLATELAQMTGESLTGAVTLALRDALKRAQRQRDAALKVEALMEIARRYSALPDAEPRTPDEIIGYDEIGLPR
jgi:antitoxin VapB